jgi:hypothetical protein
MKHLTAAFLLGLTSLVAHAQTFKTDKPVVCSDLKTVIETVSGDYQEEPVWRGSSGDSKFIMMANTKTGTWTFIQYNEKVACVLGTGDNGKPIRLGKSV